MVRTDVDKIKQWTKGDLRDTIERYKDAARRLPLLVTIDPIDYPETEIAVRENAIGALAEIELDRRQGKWWIFNLTRH